MNRRAFGAGLAAVLGASRITLAQQGRKTYRLGILGNVPLTDSEGARLWGALRDGLRELGYVEGQNLIVDHRSSEGRYERIPGLAADLIRSKPDVIVVPNTSNAIGAHNATQTIPIVAATLDPLGSGLAATFARPGGNVTGLSLLSPEIVGKQLELLREMVPRVSRVAILLNPANPSSPRFVEQAKSASRTLGLQLHVVEVRQPDELESGFTRIRRERTRALLVFSDAMFIVQRTRMAELAITYHVPTMHMQKEHMEAGGLSFYGAAMVANFRRAAVYVDKILKGANPGDLPVEQPTKFEFVINLKTARALGLAIPPSLLLRADQIIDP